MGVWQQKNYGVLVKVSPSFEKKIKKGFIAFFFHVSSRVSHKIRFAVRSSVQQIE